MIDFSTQKMFTVLAELYKANEGMDKKKRSIGEASTKNLVFYT